MQAAPRIPEPIEGPSRPLVPAALYLAAGTAAFSAIAYELLLATYATFLMGASIFQYSLVLSLMMASMGVGALLSDRVPGDPARVFLAVEVAIALLAAVALPLLYYAYARDFMPRALLVFFVTTLGAGIGMEIPLLNSLQGRPEGLPRILFFDYLGGFLGGLVFPLVLVPRMSLFQIGGLLALLNGAVACLFALCLRDRLRPRPWAWGLTCLGVFALAFFLFRSAEGLRIAMEGRLFGIQVQ